MRHARILLAVLIAAVFVPVAAAQDYPNRPITLVVPFAPGGGVDQMARLIAGKLEQRLGKSFVIENKPGAGSIIAATYVQKSNPDGYTLLMAPAPTMAVNVSLYKKPAVRPDHRLQPDRIAVGHALRADGQCRSAGEVGAGAARLRQGQSRQDDIRVGRSRRAASSVHGIVHEHDRDEGVARALSRQPAGAQRSRRRPHPDDVLRSRSGDRRCCEAKRVRPLGISTKTRHPSFPDIPPLGDAACRATRRCRGRRSLRRRRRRGRFSTSSTPRSPPCWRCRR